MKAVVLARGIGTRMRRANASAGLDARQVEMAEAGLKGMIPIGRPFLDYLLSALADAGVRDVCLVIGPEHQVVREHYARVVPRRLRVSFAVQQHPIGTADAVRAAESFAGSDRFLVLNSDNYYPVAAYRALLELDGAGAVGFQSDVLVNDGNLDTERVDRFPLFRTDADGRLVELVERDDVPGRGGAGLISMNLWQFTTEIFASCRAIRPSPRGELELSAAVCHALSRGVPFRVVPFTAPVWDMTHRTDVPTVAGQLESITVTL